MGFGLPGLESEKRPQEEKKESGERTRHHGVGELWKHGHEGWPIGFKSIPDGTGQVITWSYLKANRYNSRE